MLRQLNFLNACFAQRIKERIVQISPMLKKIMIKYERIRDAYLRDNILHYDNYFLSYRNKPLIAETVEKVVKIVSEIAKASSLIVFAN